MAVALSVGLLAGLATAPPAQAQPDYGFNANLGSGFNNVVQAMVRQPDGRIIVGGIFTKLGGQTVASNLARLMPDGTLDSEFEANLGTGVNGSVTALALARDGGIMVAGGFTAVNGDTTVPDRLMRLLPSGARDDAFNASLGTGLNGAPTGVAVQGDSKVLVGGAFTQLNGTASGVPKGVFRLNSDGTLDSSFNANLGSGLDSNLKVTFAVQNDGRILLGGSFTTLGGVDVPDRLVRLTSSGTLDGAFNSSLGTGFNDWVYRVVLDNRGNVLVGGSFTRLGVATVATGLVRLNNSGLLDATFNSDLGASVYSLVWDITVLPDDRIVVTGPGSAVGSWPPGGMRGLKDDGYTDTSLDGYLEGGFNDYVLAVASTPRGTLIAAGSFTAFSSPFTYGPIPAHLMEFNPPPGVVRGLTANPVDGGAELRWRVPLLDGGTPISTYGFYTTGYTRCWVTGEAAGYVQARCTGMTNGSQDVISVYATSDAGDGNDLGESVTPRTTPDAPGTPSVTAVGNGSLSLAWAAPASDGGAAITSYRLSAAPGGGACTIDAVARTAACTGLANGTAYTFRVRAVNAAGAGDLSDPSIPAAPRTLPGQPGAVAVRVGKGTADLTFTAPSDGGSPITRYAITKNRSRGTCTVTSVVLTTVRASCTGLASGLTHVFTVRAANAAGTGPARSSATVTVTALPGSVRALRVSRIALAAADPLPVAVRASWREPAAFDGMAVTGYRWCLDACGPHAVWHAASGRGVTLGRLAVGSSHVLRVRAVNAGGAGAAAALRFTA